MLQRGPTIVPSRWMAKVLWPNQVEKWVMLMMKYKMPDSMRMRTISWSCFETVLFMPFFDAFQIFQIKIPGQRILQSHNPISCWGLTCAVCVQHSSWTPERRQHNPRPHIHVNCGPMVGPKVWIIDMHRLEIHLQDSTNEPTQPKEHWEPEKCHLLVGNNP